MNVLAISPKAKTDLEEIKGYIAGTLGNPTAAVAVTTKIIHSIKQLRDMPLAGPSLAPKIPFGTDYRYLICGNYLAFYRYEGKTIFVDRILYGKRDYLRILFPELSWDNSLDDEDDE